MTRPAHPHNIALADYLAMVRYVVPIIRREAPAARIVIPAVSGQGVPSTSEFGTGWRNAVDRKYLFAILDSDVMPLVDAISWHPLYSNRAWTDWLPVDEDPGVPATFTLEGLAGSKAEAIDVMAGTAQQLATRDVNGGLAIEDLLVKDYPTFVRVSSR